MKLKDKTVFIFKCVLFVIDSFRAHVVQLHIELELHYSSKEMAQSPHFYYILRALFLLY